MYHALQQTYAMLPNEHGEELPYVIGANGVLQPSGMTMHEAYQPPQAQRLEDNAAGDWACSTPEHAALLDALKASDTLALDRILRAGGTELHEARFSVSAPIFPKGPMHTTRLCALGVALSVNAGGREAETVSALLRHGASLDDTVSALDQAFDPPAPLSERKAYDCARVLLASEFVSNGSISLDSAINSDGSTLLTLACEFGWTLMTRILLEAGADPNRAKNNGATPLYKAASDGRAKCVRLLLSAGANVNTPFHTGATPLVMAVGESNDRSGGAREGEDHVLCAKLLLAAGADPQLRTHDGVAPIHFARGTRCKILLSGYASKGPPPPPPPLGGVAVASGARVRLQGLQARPALNRAVGRVLEWDVEKARYAVQLRDGRELLVKPPNLEPLPEGEGGGGGGGGGGAAGARARCGRVPISLEECREARESGNPQTLAWLLAHGDIEPETLPSSEE